MGRHRRMAPLPDPPRSLPRSLRLPTPSPSASASTEPPPPPATSPDPATTAAKEVGGDLAPPGEALLPLPCLPSLLRLPQRAYKPAVAVAVQTAPKNYHHDPPPAMPRCQQTAPLMQVTLSSIYSARRPRAAGFSGRWALPRLPALDEVPSAPYVSQRASTTLAADGQATHVWPGGAASSPRSPSPLSYLLSRPHPTPSLCSPAVGEPPDDLPAQTAPRQCGGILTSARTGGAPSPPDETLWIREMTVTAAADNHAPISPSPYHSEMGCPPLPGLVIPVGPAAGGGGGGVDLRVPLMLPPTPPSVPSLHSRPRLPSVAALLALTEQKGNRGRGGPLPVSASPPAQPRGVLIEIATLRSADWNALQLPAPKWGKEAAVGPGSAIRGDTVSAWEGVGRCGVASSCRAEGCSAPSLPAARPLEAPDVLAGAFSAASPLWQVPGARVPPPPHRPHFEQALPVLHRGRPPLRLSGPLRAASAAHTFPTGQGVLPPPSPRRLLPPHLLPLHPPAGSSVLARATVAASAVPLAPAYEVARRSCPPTTADHTGRPRKRPRPLPQALPAPPVAGASLWAPAWGADAARAGPDMAVAGVAWSGAPPLQVRPEAGAVSPPQPSRALPLSPLPPPPPPHPPARPLLSGASPFRGGCARPRGRPRLPLAVSRLNRAQLLTECRKRGLSDSGTILVLRGRLMDYVALHGLLP